MDVGPMRDDRRESPQSRDHLFAELQGYRKRIRRSRRLRYLGMALAGAAALWLVAALVHYFNLPAPGMVPVAAVVSVALPALALALEYVRRPSLAQTAEALDRRLDNRQRLLTSVEIVSSGARGPLAEAQVDTSARLLSRFRPPVVYPVRAPWAAISTGVGLLFLAAGLFVLKGAVGGFTPIQAGTLPPDQVVSSALVSPTPQSGLPQSEITPPAGPTQVAQPTEVALSTAGEGESTPPPDAITTDENGEVVANDPEGRQQASEEAQSGLDRLGDALDEQSVTQPVADNIRRGDIEAAAEELRQLGEENDQLSDQAKRDLAEALDSAARDLEANPALREAMQKTARALRDGDYRDIAGQMGRLAESLRDTAAGVIPQEELAKSFPSPTTGGSEGSSGEGNQEGEGGEGEGQEGQADTGAQGPSGESGDTGEQSESGGLAGEGGAPSENPEGSAQSAAPGQGTRVDGPIESNRQASPGNPFELEGRPDPNSGSPQDPGQNRPGLELEGGGGTSGGAIPAGTGGAVDTPGESNSLPLDRWEIIRRYFTPGR